MHKRKGSQTPALAVNMCYFRAIELLDWSKQHQLIIERFTKVTTLYGSTQSTIALINQQMFENKYVDEMFNLLTCKSVVRFLIQHKMLNRQYFICHPLMSKHDGRLFKYILNAPLCQCLLSCIK